MLMGCPIHPIGYNQTVSANSTELVPLNIASNSFLAQLDLNYTASNGSTQKFVSSEFNVDDSPQSRAVTWSQGVLANPTASPSAVPRTTISASLLTSSAPTASSTLSVSKPSSTSNSRLGTGTTSSTASTAPQSSLSVSKSSPTSDSRLGAGAISGIVVGIVICVGLAASLVLYRRKNSNKIEAEVTPIPVDFIGEKDATPLQPPELSGDGQPVEMGTSYHVSTGRAWLFTLTALAPLIK